MCLLAIHGNRQQLAPIYLPSIIMPSPVRVQVPRPGRSRSSLTHQSNAYSSAINAWLGESETDAPWHNLDFIVVSSTSQDASHTNSTSLPSDNAATQGSARHDDSVTVMSTTHIQGQITLCPSTFDVSSTLTSTDMSPSDVQTCDPSKPVPASNRQQEPTNTKRDPQND